MVTRLINPAKSHDPIADLVYASYKYNRQRRPCIPPESWTKLFPHADILEKRFQAEMKGATNGG